jgi:hypothetical protein
MKRKKANKKYSLLVDTDNIILTIESDNKKGDKIIAPNTKEPRVVAPLPDPKKLMDNARYFSSRGDAVGTINGFLDKYIRTMDKNINI